LILSFALLCAGLPGARLILLPPPLSVFPESWDFVLQPEAKEQNPSFPEKIALHQKSISGAGRQNSTLEGFMTHEIENDLGYFEGFNFRAQSAIFERLTAEDVVNWDHDANGEAEFWPEGSNDFVRLLAHGNCSGFDLIEMDRIFSEVDNDEKEIAKAVYLRENHGLRLDEITREAIDDACLYVYGIGYFSDLRKDAAWDLFETLYPEAYKLCESWSVPGVSFDEEDFLQSFSTLELKTRDHQGFLVVEIA